MPKPEAESAITVTNRAIATRRKFFNRITAIVGGVGVWSRGAVAYSGTTYESEKTDSLYSGSYPVPSYLPDNYRLVAQYNNRTDGFGKLADELVLWYKNPRHPRGINNPLAIYMSPTPLRGFFGTEGHPGEPMPLSLSSGNLVTAEYHDGIWALSRIGEFLNPATGHRLHWKTDNAHSLVFQFADLTVGIRGSQLAGVTLQELFLVAASLE